MKTMFARIYCHVNIAEICHCLYINIITNKEGEANAKAIYLWHKIPVQLFKIIQCHKNYNYNKYLYSILHHITY